MKLKEIGMLRNVIIINLFEFKAVKKADWVEFYNRGYSNEQEGENLLIHT